MRIANALKLEKKQHQIAFVNIDLKTDIPLFIDPASFQDDPSFFAEKCRNDIESFFAAVLKAARDNNREKGLALLSGLEEPNETHLGLSKGKPRGRGLNRKLAQKIFANMSASKAVDSGLVSDLNDAFMFIRGIGPDIVSDITTNIIRRHLIEFTQEQFNFYDLPIETEIPCGLIWDSNQEKWIEDDTDFIPIIKKQRILLVPKQIVRWRRDFEKAGRKFYTEFFVNFVRQRELNSDGPLVTLIQKRGIVVRREVYRKDIERNHPNNKSTAEQFAVEHKDIYEKFKKSLTKHNPLSDRALMDLQEDGYRENEFCIEAAQSLREIPTGRRHATDYQYLIVGLAHFLFYPYLTNPVLERPTNSDRKRIDISFDNSATTGFFARVRTDPFLVSREVIIECKNYSEDIKNPEFDQMIARFDTRKGRFGIIFCRDIIDKERALNRCADAFKSAQGVIVVLTDTDVIELLEADMLHREQKVQQVLQNQMRNLLA
jgi:hypothetical protein